MLRIGRDYQRPDRHKGGPVWTSAKLLRSLVHLPLPGIHHLVLVQHTERQNRKEKPVKCNQSHGRLKYWQSGLVYVNIVSVIDVSKFFAVNRVRNDVAFVVVNGRQGLPRQDDILWATQRFQRFQRPEQVAKRSVHQDQSASTAADHETHLSRYSHRRYGRFVTGESRTRCRTLGWFTDDRLRPSVPVPQQHGAVLRPYRKHTRSISRYITPSVMSIITGSDVAVGCDVAFGTAKTRDDSEMTVDNLSDFSWWKPKI